MGKYRLHLHNRLNKRFKYKYQPIFKQGEPPPKIELKGRLDLQGIINTVCGGLLLGVAIFLCFKAYIQGDKRWILEVTCIFLFIGGLAILFLIVGIRLYTSGVSKGKRLSHFIILGKIILKLTIIFLVIIGIIFSVYYLQYSIRYDTIEIFISNDNGSRYNFTFDSEEVDSITVFDRRENKEIILQHFSNMEGAFSINGNYYIKYRIDKKFGSNNNAPKKYGDILSMKPY